MLAALASALSGLSTNLKLGVGALVGALIMFSCFEVANAVWLLPAARKDGRDRYVAEQAAQDHKAELERKGDDAKLQGMSDYDLCVSYRGGVPECAALKL